LLDPRPNPLGDIPHRHPSWFLGALRERGHQQAGAHGELGSVAPTSTPRRRHPWVVFTLTGSRMFCGKGGRRGTAFLLPCPILCWLRGSHPAKSPAADLFNSAW